ncbi:MAG TPA: sugar phosphate isomerase/epimerase [Planctomycetota bacterium]|nr:sugar phosphate isomerase/epimerase [Planctomycetota bacterium]
MTIARREFIKTGAIGLAAMSLAGTARADEPYGPFKMGIQSYTLRSYKTLDETLTQIKILGLKYVEFYPGHRPVTTDAAKIKEYSEKLAAIGAKAMAYGVTGLGDKPDENRKTFEFAKAIGLYTITTTFAKKAALSLDKLCEEYPDMHVGIHNHGPTDTYKSPEDVLECIKDRHKNIGATADLGHYIRSKQDPLECIEKLKDRLFGIHFKDFDAKGKETIVGDAQLKVKETLALLKKLNFQGCISLEYEDDKGGKDKLMADVKEALNRVQKACKEI